MIHAEYADLVMTDFKKRMEEYNLEFPIDTPMERFIRENRVKEWRFMATDG